MPKSPGEIARGRAEKSKAPTGPSGAKSKRLPPVLEAWQQTVKVAVTQGSVDENLGLLLPAIAAFVEEIKAGQTEKPAPAAGPAQAAPGPRPPAPGSQGPMQAMPPAAAAKPMMMKPAA